MEWNFYAIGPEIVHYLKGLEHSIFPRFEIAWHSQYGALSYVCFKNLWDRYGHLHAAGGVEMMREAKSFGR